MKAMFDREFSVQDMDPIKVFINEPVEQSDGCWKCDYEILWHDGAKTYNTSGSDKLQALLYTLSMIESRLVAESGRLGKKITFMDCDELGLFWSDWQRNIN